jgi:hypothetical protein
MAPALATYTYQFDGWHWDYRLFLDRLEADGRCGIESTTQIYELAQYSEFPQRSSYVLPTPRRALAVAVAVIVGALSLAGAIAVIVIERPEASVAKLLFIGGTLATVAAHQITMKAGARKDRVNRAEFRRLDATEAFVIWDINDISFEEFTVFVQKVQAVIRSSRPEESEST